MLGQRPDSAQSAIVIVAAAHTSSHDQRGNIPGLAAWVGAAPGGGRLQPAWDALGALAAVSGGGGRRDFLCGPGGLRAAALAPGGGGRSFAYSSSGLLLTVWAASPGGRAVARTDVARANGVAIAEIGGGGGVLELHADRLGNPRHVTDGGGPGRAANNCYAFRSFFYGFVLDGYDAARPR